jgi:transcriptional regulator with XRE-family HTH domain
METYIASVKEQALDVLNHAWSVLRTEKKARGYTNKDLANTSGISEDTVKYLLADKPPKDPRAFPMIMIAMSMELDLNYVFGYTPPVKPDTSVVTIKEDYYVSDIIMLSDKRVEDVKAMCELRLADKDAMYERIIAELKDKKETSSYVKID